MGLIVAAAMGWAIELDANSHKYTREQVITLTRWVYAVDDAWIEQRIN